MLDDLVLGTRCTLETESLVLKPHFRLRDHRHFYRHINQSQILGKGFTVVPGRLYSLRLGKALATLLDKWMTSEAV